jgi:hypothetical protein
MARTATPPSPPSPPPTISRADLQNKFQQLQDGWRGKVERKKQTILTAVGIGAVVVTLFVFLLGRRSGKRKTTVVEIRRF